MPLSPRSRAVLYESFTSLIADEQAVQEMLSSFPAREEDELATKELVKLETVLLRSEMADLRLELRREMADLRIEMSGLRTEMTAMELRLERRMSGLTWRVLAVIMPMQAATLTAVLIVLIRLTQ